MNGAGSRHAAVETAGLRQRAHHSLHHGRADGVPQQPDAVATCPLIKVKILGEPHGAFEFWYLKHAQHGHISIPGNKAEPIERGESPNGTIEGVPAPGTVRSVIDDQERNASTECLDGPPGAFQGRACSPPVMQRGGKPCTLAVQDLARRPPSTDRRCHRVGQALAIT